MTKKHPAKETQPFIKERRRNNLHLKLADNQDSCRKEGNPFFGNISGFRSLPTKDSQLYII